MEKEGRILHRQWDKYDTREVVYQTSKMSAAELKAGYDWAYKEFYSWTSIFKASMQHDHVKHMLKHFAYAGGWKKFEPLWNFIIKSRQLNNMLPLLEAILSKVKKQPEPKKESDILNDMPVALPIS
jgi:hypothetical protein